MLQTGFPEHQLNPPLLRPGGHKRDHGGEAETGTGHHGAAGEGQTGEFGEERISFLYIRLNVFKPVPIAFLRLDLI